MRHKCFFASNNTSCIGRILDHRDRLIRIENSRNEQKSFIKKKETANILAKVEKDYFRFISQFAIDYRLRLDPDFLLRRFPIFGPAAQDQEVQPGEGVLQTSGRTRRSDQVGFSLTKFRN